ncbi:MAG: LemA family protein [bacterium]|nr:LemA family protein [bacterium]
MAHPSLVATLRNVTLLLSLYVLSTLLSGCGINNIPTYEENAKAKWSQVLNQYQRRSDLVPNIVKTVKGFAAHEKDVLISVVNARAKATSLNLPAGATPTAEQLQKLQAVQGQLSGALSKLLLVVERYPDLKSNQNFLQLQTALEGTENRIGVARRDYIEAVRAYNTELKTIPGRWWKQAMYPTNEPLATFTVAKEKTMVPEVKFN